MRWRSLPTCARMSFRSQLWRRSLCAFRSLLMAIAIRHICFRCVRLVFGRFRVFTTGKRKWPLASPIFFSRSPQRPHSLPPLLLPQQNPSGGPLLASCAPQKAPRGDAALGARRREGSGAVSWLGRKLSELPSVVVVGVVIFLSLSGPGPPRPGPREKRPAAGNALLCHGIRRREGLCRPGSPGAPRRRRGRGEGAARSVRGRGGGARPDPLRRRPRLPRPLQTSSIVQKQCQRRQLLREADPALGGAVPGTGWVREKEAPAPRDAGARCLLEVARAQGRRVARGLGREAHAGARRLQDRQPGVSL